MANRDFYDELDLRYPEIAICIDIIDRTNPGTKNFYIPILTPNVDTTSLTTKTETVYQNNASIANENKVNISNVKIQNYIPITIPKELCAYTGGNYIIKNNNTPIGVDITGEISITGNTEYAPGLASHMHSTLDGIGRTHIYGSINKYEGDLNIVPRDDERYIPAGSKWIVVFIGGDIGKPQIIGRYTDPE